MLLAVGVLWWFLRDVRATALIATAIPISLLTTFIVLELTGRSLNVISLAGLAAGERIAGLGAVARVGVVAHGVVGSVEAGVETRVAAVGGARDTVVARRRPAGS